MLDTNGTSISNHGAGHLFETVSSLIINEYILEVIQMTKKL